MLRLSAMILLKKVTHITESTSEVLFFSKLLSGELYRVWLPLRLSRKERQINIEMLISNIQTDPTTVAVHVGHGCHGY